MKLMGHFIGSVRVTPHVRLSVDPLVGWLVGRTVCQYFLKGGMLNFNAPRGALVCTKAALNYMTFTLGGQLAITPYSTFVYKGERKEIFKEGWI